LVKDGKPDAAAADRIGRQRNAESPPAFAALDQRSMTLSMMRAQARLAATGRRLLENQLKLKLRATSADLTDARVLTSPPGDAI